MTRLHLVLFWIVGASLGCGAAPSHRAVETTSVVRPAPSSPHRTSARRAVMETRGLTGSLAPEEVTRALAPAYGRFAGCFATQTARLPMLAGRVTLAFHLAIDGRVASVHPIDSTVGHRDVERCIVGVAASVQFPRPHGGETDFTWPLEMDPPDGVREAVTWDPGRVSGVVRARGRRVLERCRAGDSDIQVTTYVSSGGRVIAAGASSPDPSHAESLDCVAHAVRSWRMPRSTHRRAKVTFNLRAGG